MRVVIVGGGVTGLATAYYLRREARRAGAPLTLTLIEGAGRLGGVIRTERLAGCLLEAGPDSFLSDDPQMLELVDALGLGAELHGANARNRRSFVVRGRKLLAIPEGFSLLAPTKLWPFAASPALSPLGKLRALLEPAIPPRTDLEADESIGAFVRRRFGGETYAALAEPVMRGLASGDPETLSMRAILPRFVELEARYGSVLRGLRATRAPAARQGSAGPRYGLFVSFHDGMQRLIDQLAGELSPSEIRLGTTVRAIGRGRAARWSVDLHTGERLDADGVCLAVPPARAAALVRGFDAELARRCTAVHSCSWLTVHMAFPASGAPQRPAGFGFVVPAREGLPVAGCTFMHVKFPGRAPEGVTLFRMFVPCHTTQGETGPSDADAVSLSRSVLQQVLGIREEPILTRVFRAPGALPVYHVGHVERIAAIEERLRAHPGMVVAGNAYQGHGVTRCVASARRAADRLNALPAARAHANQES